MNPISTGTVLGDRWNGGALFTIPRELRDEIYRLVFKRQYILPEYCNDGGFSDTNLTKADMAILRVSRAVGYEAQELLYLESTFRVVAYFNPRIKDLKPPPQALHRVKKVEIVTLLPWHFSRRVVDWSSKIEEICEVILGNFTGTAIRRDSCHIQCGSLGSAYIFRLMSHILPRLAAFNGFDTILMEASIEAIYKRIERQELYGRGRTLRKLTRHFEGFNQVVKDGMEPTLGPAKISKDRFTSRFEFRPREHLRSDSRKPGSEAIAGG